MLYEGKGLSIKCIIYVILPTIIDLIDPLIYIVLIADEKNKNDQEYINFVLHCCQNIYLCKTGYKLYNYVIVGVLNLTQNIT